MITLGEFEVHFDSDDDRRRFEAKMDELEQAGQRRANCRSLEDVEQGQYWVQSELERLEDVIKCYQDEIAELQNHIDWLTGQAAKLTAERLRMEEEGRAVVGAVEGIYGISPDC